MTNNEILTKAITKAIAGGWNKFGYEYWDWTNEDFSAFSNPTDLDHDQEKFSLNDIIFSHNFAQSLWPGTIRIKHACSYPDCTDEYEEVSAWKYHLQQLVISEDPFRYLEKHL